MTLAPSHASTASLRVLCVLANPVDLVKFDSERMWRELARAIGGLQSLVFERLGDPTETGLRQALQGNAWDVLHLIAHGQERTAAHYGTIALQSTDGHARNLTAPYFGEWLGGSSSLKLIVLQGCDEKCGFDTIADKIAENNMTAVILPALDGEVVNAAVTKLYAGVLAGLSANDLNRELLGARQAVPPGQVRVVSRHPEEPIWAKDPVENASVIDMPKPLEPAPVSTLVVSESAPSEAAPKQSDWQTVLAEKRKRGQFDVFLCHNSIDKPAVKAIAHRLKENGILPWLDVWELPPGQPWQPLLEMQIEAIHSAAVFVGSAGVAPWQENEMRGFLEEFRNRDMPVIPVLLPGSPSVPRLPLFLRQMTWVDFRSEDPDPLQLLVWGITGERPKD